MVKVLQEIEQLRIGVRLDFDDTVLNGGKQHKRYKLQVNKNTENSTLKELADQNPHKVWSQADIPVGEDHDPEDLFDALEEICM